MKDQIQKIIERSIQKVEEKEEIKRFTVLNILHANIDRLIENAGKWFGTDIPVEYEKIIRSLMTLSMSSLVADHDWLSRIADENTVELDLREFFSLVQNEIEGLFPMTSFEISIDWTEELLVHTRPYQFKESLYSIMLSLILYMDDKSTCHISIEKQHTSVFINMRFSDLSFYYPGIETIKKAIFSHSTGADFKVGIGLSSAFSILRSIGARVRIINNTEPQSMELEIIMASSDFFAAVTDVRNVADKKIKKSRSGNVILMIDDPTLGLFLNEILPEEGYSIITSDNVDFEDKKTLEDCRAIVADYEYIEKHFLNCKVFETYIRLFPKVIVIYGSDTSEFKSLERPENFIFLKKPLEVDRILLEIDS